MKYGDVHKNINNFTEGQRERTITAGEKAGRLGSKKADS